MLVKYDDRRIKLTPRFITALKELMAAECEMLGNKRGFDASCWWGGEAEIQDLADANGIWFSYGPKDERPNKKARFAVTAAKE